MWPKCRVTQLANDTAGCQLISCFVSTNHIALELAQLLFWTRGGWGVEGTTNLLFSLLQRKMPLLNVLSPPITIICFRAQLLPAGWASKQRAGDARSRSIFLFLNLTRFLCVIEKEKKYARNEMLFFHHLVLKHKTKYNFTYLGQIAYPFQNL